MALRDIVTDGVPLLRKKSRIVESFDEKLAKLLSDMLETMKANDGVGLAAPQVGILRQVAICEVGEGENFEIIELVNPKIIKKSGRQVGTEGCLSVPQKRCEVFRPNNITVSYYDRHGLPITRNFSGSDAVVCSHEIDHLHGILFYDKRVKVIKNATNKSK